MKKSEIFQEEIQYIQDNAIRNSTKAMVEAIPDYFFEEAASSTGKYHPSYSLGKGGLLRHTKAAVRIAKELLDDKVIGDKYTQHEKDLMIAALIMHDSFKRGIVAEKYTRADHPLIAANYIYEHKEEFSLKEEDALFLQKVIASHMGPSNKDYQGGEILPIPKTKWESFVHLCDYLASRKFLLVPFDEKDHITV